MSVRFFAVMLALLPVPAFADVTARYAVDKEVLVIEAEDGGNARIGIDGKFSVIHRDGVDYALLFAPGGETKVAALADLVSFMVAITKGKPQAAKDAGKEMILTAIGEASVAGRTGAAWSLGFAGASVDPAAKGPHAAVIVVSSDPALAPVGAVFRRLFTAVLPFVGGIIPASSKASERIPELLAKGTPLRVTPILELQSVDNAEIAADRFALPGPVIAAAEFLAALDSHGAEGALKPLP